MKNLIITLITLLVFTSVLSASPKEAIQMTVDEVVEIVEKDRGNVDTEAIRKKVNQIFDFQEMAKRSLGMHWKKIEDEQRQEFSDVFAEFLATTYMKRIDDLERGMCSINSEKVIGNRALVKTTINIDDTEFPIDYKMLLKPDQKWYVYDVVIENIGLVSNYRNEFSGILRKNSVEELIVQLSEKTAKLKAS